MNPHKQRIIHYDIKPGNILLVLDAKFGPGLAKLCNREITHVTLTGGRGTPWYAVPRTLDAPAYHLQMCDGMLLFEINTVGRRRNLNVNAEEWEKTESGEMGDVMDVRWIEDKNRFMVEKMAKVASSVVCSA